MRKKRIAADIIAPLPLAAALVALCFAPETLPLGFDAAGEPDEWGPKWTLLLWPLIVLALRLALAALRKLVSLDRDGARLATYMDGASLAVTAFFALIALYKLAAPLLPGLDMSRSARDGRIVQFASALLGVLYISAGDELGAIPYNRNIGLKTRHTLADEAVWRAAHAFLGRAAAVAGGCTIVLSAVIPGVWSLPAALAAFALAVAAAALYARREHVKRRASEGKERA